MKRLLFIIVVLACALTACKKNNNKGCGTKMCTEVFTSFGMAFANHDGSRAEVTDVTLLNLRTDKRVTLPPYPTNVDFEPGIVFIASDATKAEFSTEGDDVKLTAKSKLTGQVKSVNLKIAGGCNCHVGKLAGPDLVTFD